MNNLLSIDFGERYMGFAIRTVKTQIPIPIEVVDIKKDNIANKISTYVDSYDINEFIIGYPVGMNLSENRMTNNVDNFIEVDSELENLLLAKTSKNNDLKEIASMIEELMINEKNNDLIIEKYFKTKTENVGLLVNQIKEC